MPQCAHAEKPKSVDTAGATAAHTTKNEFLRYIDAHESACPLLVNLADYYRERNPTRHTFGMWLHARHIVQFQRAYNKWWLKQPSLWGIIYKEFSARQ